MTRAVIAVHCRGEDRVRTWAGKRRSDRATWHGDVRVRTVATERQSPVDESRLAHQSQPQVRYQDGRGGPSAGHPWRHRVRWRHRVLGHSPRAHVQGVAGPARWDNIADWNFAPAETVCSVYTWLVTTIKVNLIRLRHTALYKFDWLIELTR